MMRNGILSALFILVVVLAAGLVVFAEDKNEAAAIDEHNKLKAKINPKTAADFLKLGSETFTAANSRHNKLITDKRRKLLQLAKADLQQALKLKPKYEPAQLYLEQVRKALADIPGGGDDDDDDDDDAGPFPRVKKADIYRIRRVELREGDRVRVTFRDKVEKRFIEWMEGREEFEKAKAEKAFRRLSKVRKAVYMLERAPEEMKEDILIETDPDAIKKGFRQVWRIVEPRCASGECHGGEKPKGGVIFFTRGGQSERTEYTNFVLLNGIQTGNGRLIDRSDPEASLLLQYGLPPELARQKHPGKPNRNRFRNRKDTNYRKVERWIDGLARHPDYKLEYKAPFNIKLSMKQRTVLPDVATRPATTRPAPK